MKNMHTLPDLLAAPYSNLQGLARRLIEYADWSALPAIVDELQEQGRWYDLHQLRTLLALRQAPYETAYVQYREGWPYWVENLTALFYFDLFDIAGVATELGRVKWNSKEELERSLLDLQSSFRQMSSRNFITLPQTYVSDMSHE